MYQRTPIISVLDPQLVGAGLQEDMHPVQKLLWTEAENVSFRQGRVQRLVPKGLFRDFSAAGSCRGISQHQMSNGRRMVTAAFANEIYRYDGVTQQLRHTFPIEDYAAEQTSIAQATYADFVHYGDWTIYNISKGSAYIDKDGAGLVEYATAPSDVVLFMKKLNFMLAIGHGVTGTKLSWSNADDIENWTESASGEAGEMAIEDFDTRIRGAARLGQHIAIYSEDQMALVSFINAPFYFGQRVVLDGIGLVGKAAVASDGASNYGVGRNGVWWTDSVSYKYIDEGRMREYFQDNVNWDQRSKIIAVRNDVTNCIEFFFPMGLDTDISEGWSFDPRNSAWSPLPAARFKAERQLFDYALEGDGAGTLYYSQADVNAVGPLNLKTKPMPPQLQQPHGLTDVHNECEISELVLFAKTASNVQVRYGTSKDAEAAPNFSSWIDVAAGTKTIRNQAGVPSGIYTTLEFRSTANNWEFNLQGLLIFGTVEGTKLDHAT